MITSLLLIIALACTIYRLTIVVTEQNTKAINEALKMPIKIGTLSIPTDAEEASTNDITVYKKVSSKYIRNSSKKEWKAVCRKCPGCGHYLPVLIKNSSIVCPKCKLINYNFNYNTFVWK